MSWKEAKEQGAAAYKAGDLPGAVQAFSRAIDADKDNAGGQLHVLYSNRSAAYLSLGRALDAAADAEKCVQLDPTWPKGYSRKGAALFRLAKYTESMTAYQKALELEPSNGEYRKGMEDARKAAAENGPPGTAEVKTRLQQFMVSNRLATLLFLPRLFLIANTLLFLLPVTSRHFAFACYRRVLFTAIGQFIYVLYTNHGRPQFNMNYLARVMQDTAIQYLFMCFLLLAGRPNVIAITSILLQEGMSVIWFVGQVIGLYRPALAKQIAGQTVGLMVKFTGDPRYGTLSGYQKWAAIFREVPKYAATMEIAAGLVFLLELVTPYRNFFLVFAYFQFLQMRYMLDRDGPFKKAVKAYDLRITNLTNHPACPRMIGNLYLKLRDVLAKATAIPEPGQRPAAPRCTIS